MENNQAISKINKIGKAGTILALIAKIFLIIGFIGCFIALIAVTILPEDFVTFKMNGVADVTVDFSALNVALPEDEIRQSILEDVESNTIVSYGNTDLDVTDVEVSESAINFVAGGDIVSFNMRSCAYAIVVGMIYIVMSFISVLFVGFLAKAFANCKSPFDEDVIRKMKHFAYSLIPWALMSCIANAFLSNVFTGRSEHMNFNINVGYVFIVLVILALSYIFKYGAMLQKEADETL